MFPRVTQLVLLDCNSILRFTQLVPSDCNLFPRSTLVLSDCNSFPLNALCKSKGRISIRDSELCKSRERIAQFIVTCTITIYFCLFFYIKIPMCLQGFHYLIKNSLNSTCKTTETSKTVESNRERHLLF